MILLQRPGVIDISMILIYALYRKKSNIKKDEVSSFTTDKRKVKERRGGR
jgi:hypothetical protein